MHTQSHFAMSINKECSIMVIEHQYLSEDNVHTESPCAINSVSVISLLIYIYIYIYF